MNRVREDTANDAESLLANTTSFSEPTRRLGLVNDTFPRQLHDRLKIIGLSCRTMLGWLIFAVVLAVVGGVLTIIWWRVGDIWADEENKRFRGGGDDADPERSGPMVIRGFDSANDRQQDRPDTPD